MSANLFLIQDNWDDEEEEEERVTETKTGELWRYLFTRL